MGNLTAKGECAEFIDYDQFETGKSQDTCGPAAVSTFWHCVQPGHQQIWNARQCQLMMESDYAHYIGPDTAADHNGTSNETLYKMLAGHRFHYLAIPTSIELIKLVVGAGYPVIIGFSESSVIDLDLGGVPYGWDTSGLFHIVVVSGPGSGDELLVRDTANVGRPGPRRYKASHLQLTSATVCCPSWMPWQ